MFWKKAPSRDDLIASLNKTLESLVALNEQDKGSDKPTLEEIKTALNAGKYPTSGARSARINSQTLEELSKLQFGAQTKLDQLEGAMSVVADGVLGGVQVLSVLMTLVGVGLVIYALTPYGSGLTSNAGVGGILTTVGSVASGALANSSEATRKAGIDRIQTIIVARSWVLAMNLHLWAMQTTGESGNFTEDCRKSIRATAKAIEETSLAHVKALEDSVDQKIAFRTQGEEPGPPGGGATKLISGERATRQSDGSCKVEALITPPSKEDLLISCLHGSTKECSDKASEGQSHTGGEPLQYSAEIGKVEALPYFFKIQVKDKDRQVVKDGDGQVQEVK